MPARRNLGAGGPYLSSVAEQTAQEDAIYWSIKGEGTEETGVIVGEGFDGGRMIARWQAPERFRGRR
jgi:hypothetical protein